MLKTFSTLIIAILFSIAAYAQTSYLNIVDPQRRVQQSQGIIDDVEIDVTPEGAYARIDMTFSISAQNQYKTTDTLEGVLTFSLPNGSYIYDSWLWLDQQTIIVADVIERNRAITIYEGIVNRRRDPSLLVKTGTNSYKLNVFPMTTIYPRKVKISYAVPVYWQMGESKIPLPVDLIRSSKDLPNITLKVNRNSLFQNPSFVVQDYNLHYISTTGGQDILNMSGAFYAQSNLTLKYNTPSINTVSVITYPTGNNEGYYQLLLPPSVIDKTSTRCVSVILDYQSTTFEVYTQIELAEKLRIALLNNYNTIDSFNLFYVNNNQIIQAFNSWRPIDKTNVDQAFKNVPNTAFTPSAMYEDLLKTGMQYCTGKSAEEAEVLLIGSNNDYTIDQQKTNTLFKNIETALGGKYNHKINIINNNRNAKYIPGASGYYYANEILYNKLILATNGQYFKNFSYTYKYVNGILQYTYSIDIDYNVKQISTNAGVTTSAYNILLKPKTGFIYNEYNVLNNQKLNLSNNYITLGKYKGDLTVGSTLNIQVITNNKTINKTITINNITPGTKGLVTDWAHQYIEELIGYYNQSYVQEIIDSSINNRVLCNYTAFLAVETGDTLNTNIDDNQSVTVKEGLPPTSKIIKAYPNPFNNQITIELPIDAEQIDIYDILGRKVFTKTLSKNNKKYVWNGTDNNGDVLSAGTYIITIRTETGKQTLKVQKQ